VGGGICEYLSTAVEPTMDAAEFGREQSIEFERILAGYAKVEFESLQIDPNPLWCSEFRLASRSS
jgi:hypothetical protein